MAAIPRLKISLRWVVVSTDTGEVLSESFDRYTDAEIALYALKDELNESLLLESVLVKSIN